MSLVTVIVPNTKTYTFSGNGTIQKLLPKRVECKPCGEQVSNECPVCLNDTPTANYTTCEGSLYFQFFITDNFNPDPQNPVDGWGTWLTLTIVTPTTSYPISTMSDVCVNWWVASVEGQSIQMLQLDMAKVCALLGTEKCFYLEVGVCKRENNNILRPNSCGITLPLFPIVGQTFFNAVTKVYYLYTVTGWQVQAIAADTYVYCQAANIFYYYDGATWTATQGNPPIYGDPVCNSQCFTEVYKIQNCEKLILLEGFFTEWDCLGFYYGVPEVFVGSSAEPFIMEFYVQASLETQSYPVEETKSDDESLILSRKLSEVALFRTWGITKYQAKKIANVFMAETWLVNSEEWDSSKEVSKNNDNGENWYVNLELTREICEKNSTACDE